MPQVETQKILDANAAWQSQVIEAFGICPFARQCREDGRLYRAVLLEADDALSAALERAIVGMQLLDDKRQVPAEVALLLCPYATTDARLFEQLVHQCTDRANAAVRARGGVPQYHVVAFHPQMVYATTDPAKLVAFWRRSPHPTVQLVHIATLQRLRGDAAPLRYVDAQDAHAVAALVGQPVAADLADRIALANWRTFHGRGEEIEAAIRKLADRA